MSESTTSGRTIAIGDVHGCSRALQAIVEAIAPQPHDQIVVLGDFIDRGPDTRGVIDELLALRSRCQLVTLLGNHEEMLLAACQGTGGPREWNFWMGYGGRETLASYGGRLESIPPEHIQLLFRCAPFYETDSHLFLHANYVPELPLPQQPEAELRWVSLVDFTPGPHLSDKTAVVGHTAQVSGEILVLDHLVCIDTYCHGGGWLTAMDVHARQLWQADFHGKLRP